MSEEDEFELEFEDDDEEERFPDFCFAPSLFAVADRDSELFPWPTSLPSTDFFLFRGFLRREDATKRSSALNVDGLSVSKSISISSGLESLRAASRD